MKTPGADQRVAAHIDITRKRGGPVKFDLSALEHSLELQPTLSARDYDYLLHNLVPNDGWIKAADLIPGDDGIERSYGLMLFQWASVRDSDYHLVLHLLERNGTEHVAYWYRGCPDGSWTWFAGNFWNDANTWEFEFNDHRRLYAAAKTAALQRSYETR